MRNFIALFMIAFLIGLSNVSADDTNTGSTDDTSTGSVIEDTNTGSTDDNSDDDESSDDESSDDESSDDESSDDESSEDESSDDESSEDVESNTSVKETQKEFIEKFNELKAEYKDRMNNEEGRREFLKKRNELFAEYKIKLAEATKVKKVEMKGKVEMKKEEVKTQIKTKRDEIKAKYRVTYAKKYGKMINKFDATKAQILIDKIDDLIEQVNSGSYSDETKEKFGAMLESLRELAEARLNAQDEPTLDVESLFQ